MSDAPAPILTLAELPELRRKTESVAQHLKAQVVGHLETLRPILAPERVFGKLVGGKSEVTGTERALIELREKYQAFTRRPYDLPGEFDPSWLTLVGTGLELLPWDYTLPVQGRTITMTAPLRWIITYRSGFTIAQVREAASGKTPARIELLRQFIVNTMVLSGVITRNPGVQALLTDLRYELTTEMPGDLRGLPLVTVTSHLKSFRPPDDLISAATAFSGVPAFIELIDPASIQLCSDQWQQKLRSLMA